MGEFDQSLVTFITFFPLLTALGLMGTSIIASALGASGLPATLWKPIALASTILTFLLSLRLFAIFDPIQTGFQLMEHGSWIPDYGINYFVGVDGISLLMVMLTTFLMPIVLLYCLIVVNPSCQLLRPSPTKAESHGIRVGLPGYLIMRHITRLHAISLRVA